VEQWRYQFRTWSTIKDNQIGRFSSQHKENVSILDFFLFV